MKNAPLFVECVVCGELHRIEEMSLQTSFFGFMPAVLFVDYRCPKCGSDNERRMELIFGDPSALSLTEEYPQEKGLTDD